MPSTSSSLTHDERHKSFTLCLLVLPAWKFFPGLIHCFTAGPELARRALDIGFYISISGIATFKNAEKLRQTILTVPEDRLLVETDAPYLAPVPHRGKRNEPSFVADTAGALANLFDTDFETLAARTTNNFYRLFTKAPLREIT